jgi:hypothetical protein
MKTRLECHKNCQRGLSRRWGISNVLALAVTSLTPIASNAYTAAGDRNFPAQLILPQIGPTDALRVPISTQPVSPALNNGKTRVTSFTGTYSKLITERLGIQLEYGASHVDRLGASSVTGRQNFHALLQYEPILDPEREFLLSIQVEHEYGGTGSQAAGISEKHGATTPGVTFGKGLGDLPIGYWPRSRSPALPATRSVMDRGPTFSRPASPCNILYRTSFRRWQTSTYPRFSTE